MYFSKYMLFFQFKICGAIFAPQDGLIGDEKAENYINLAINGLLNQNYNFYVYLNLRCQLIRTLQGKTF